MEVLQGIGAVLEGGWRMLTEVKIPGLNFSFAALLVGVVMVNLGFRFLSYVLGFGFGGVGNLGYFTSGNARASKEYRQARNTRAKIADERKNDEF